MSHMLDSWVVNEAEVTVCYEEAVTPTGGGTLTVRGVLTRLDVTGLILDTEWYFPWSVVKWVRREN